MEMTMMATGLLTWLTFPAKQMETRALQVLNAQEG